MAHVEVKGQFFSLFSFHHIDPRDWTLVIRLGSSCLYLPAELVHWAVKGFITGQDGDLAPFLGPLALYGRQEASLPMWPH